MRMTFKKHERLHQLSLIRKLFENGTTFIVQPFKITWHLTEGEQEVPGKILLSVPKHLFSKAFERNRIKRRIREAYRKNKNILGIQLRGKNKSLVFSISYISKKMLSYSEIQDKIIVLLNRLKVECEKAD